MIIYWYYISIFIIMFKKIKKSFLLKSKDFKKKYSKLYKYLFRPFQAFTLMELIVVITIFTILSTLAYVSVNWYIRKARDISRMENLRNIELWIELYVNKRWFYPEPENFKEIHYSWALLWTQWTYWKVLNRKIWTLSKKPIDLVSLNDFTYSLANDKRQYELAAIYEWEEIGYNNLITTTFASWKRLAKSMVIWNYNWFSLNVNTWSLVYILSLPTILSNDISETDITRIIEKRSLAYKWYWNLAESYSWTVFKTDWWFDFSPNIFVLYAWDYDDLINNESEWINVLKNTQLAYSWTVLASDGIISNITNIDIDTVNPSKEVRELAYDIVKNQLNINVPIVLTSWETWLTYDLWNSTLDGDIRSILQDSSLDMWFATKKWISTFIWNTWWAYTETDWLADKDVRSILEASSWKLWFATKKWISVYDWTNWNSLDKSDGLIDNDVVDLIEDSSWNFWFATKKWISMYDWSNWEDHKESDWIANKIVTWLSEQWGDIWISTINWVSKFDGSNWVTYNESDWLVDKNVLNVFSDNSWNIWFWTINWVSKFDWTNWTSYQEVDWLIDKKINNIFQDNNWDMWFATAKWVSKFDWIDWTSFQEADWLADKDAQVIFQDNEDNIWIWTKKWVTIYFD